MRNPAYFQGQQRKKKYFEGWYFKCISADRRRAIAIIPGLAISPTGEKHAFIQIIDATTGKTWYHPYPITDFWSPTDHFAIRIEQNIFGQDGLTLHINRPEGRIKGHLTFSDTHLFPSTRSNPGIMGPFSFIPFMECFHAIVDLYHQLAGVIELDGEILDFTGGVGYIEKDYGRSFPRTYLWLQASHFGTGTASFVFSRARIPLLGFEFPGFFAYFSNFTDISVRFATYNHSRLQNWQVDTRQRSCAGELTGPAGTLTFTAQMTGGGSLRAPVDGLMDREIIESITARVTVRLTDRHGHLRFHETSNEAGMEICL